MTLQLREYSLGFIPIRGPGGQVTCEKNREMLRGIIDMALGLYFTPSSFTPARYDDTIKRLDEVGAGSPPEGFTTWPWKRTA